MINFFCKCARCSKKSLSKIHLVDKCLIFFMFILLTQSAISLFLGGTIPDDANDINLIMRTSSAAIFGYFLSANFIRRSSQPPQIQTLEIDTTKSYDDIPREASSSKLQIIVATSIGIFCLVVLIIHRDLASANTHYVNSESASITIAQFRDFVSGCVGFLIGTPTHRENP